MIFVWFHFYEYHFFIIIDLKTFLFWKKAIEYGSSNESVLEYVKGDSLGSGAFGTVFKAFNSSHGTIIALKVSFLFSFSRKETKRKIIIN